MPSPPVTRDIVITSYSIHYTKLYELPRVAPLDSKSSASTNSATLASKGNVITSYSIHYTKLYEMPLRMKIVKSMESPEMNVSNGSSQ